MSAESTITILKALADKTRLDIVRALVRDHSRTASCTEVSACSGLSQPAMSHHLGKLVDAGVLTENKIGAEKIYTLNSDLLARSGINSKKL